jgi:hypothetical protein
MSGGADPPPLKRQRTLTSFWSPGSKSEAIVQLKQTETPSTAVVPLENALVAMTKEYQESKGGVGGRPKKPVSDLRGVANGVDKSNRLEPCMERRRKEVTPWEGLKICKFMDQCRPQFADEESWARHCYLRYRPMKLKQLKSIWAKGLEFWQKKVEDRGIGAGSRGTLNMRGQSLKMCHRLKTAKGCRAPGGGRKDTFRIFKDGLKTWFIGERENGHALDGAGLLEQFKILCRQGNTGWSSS